ncbi:helix-turn-helix transcriptional regulator [Caldibacillus lycopersici]|uniref:Helix-turn-helix transcriptional regulator n=1 Tax=Perspicuibacillus lycopersici TaxID=1325689 RepID=A0AAE3IUG4_9BACI|nr:helix-turn-helix transcriptional regulator [Perspicuibacillus lycopersici]MCU9614813.1 helix-turn-helix transcriptional regulator [Perspicuibacillus lycopersici]
MSTIDNQIGKRIKYHRLKLNMTQSELSDGIISVSYLSKIENGTAEPDMDVIGLLCKRLKIDPHARGNDKDFELYKMWFNHLLVGGREESSKLYSEISKINAIGNTSLMKLVELHKLRYFLLVNNKNEADKQYAYLKKISKNFTEIENYYWLKFSANYHYSLLSYSKALYLYQQAEKHLSKDLIFYSEEESDLYYRISVTASKMRQTHVSLFYVNKALKFYKDIYNLRKCAECHILLGISYLQINELINSMENYRLAATIAESIKDDGILSVCNQNIGNLFSKMHNPKQAIEHYLKSYELRESFSPTQKIIPISSIMKEYYEIGDLKNAEFWLEKGIELSKQLNPVDSIYIYEFEVYTHLIKGFDHTFEELMTKRVLPFLDDKKLHHEKFQYSQILADYYFNERKYKLAATYYKSAVNAINISKE